VKNPYLYLWPWVFGVMVLAGTGCSKAPPQPAQSSSAQEVVASNQILKITLMAGGQIRVNGQSVTLDGLNQALDALSVSGGTVWYYRESGVDGLPPHAMEILQSVVSHRLPIRLSVEPDFSDFIVAQRSS
jgi:hypothetical protein